MYDILPFPPNRMGDTKEQVMQLYNYLIQFKEELEFILTNISTDNLSSDLVAKLNSLGADISKSNAEREDQLQQVISKALTVSDVLNSAQFTAFATSQKEYADEVGTDAEQYTRELVEGLQYIVSGKQTAVSEEDGGVNVFTFTDSKGNTSAFEVKNGSKGDTPVVAFEVNFETGNLEYTTSQGE